MLSLVAGVLTGIALAATPASPPEPDAAMVTLDRLSKLDGAPRHDVLQTALAARACAIGQGEAASELLAVIDYSLPSTEPRFWLFDLNSNRLLFHELVAHGKGSGGNKATAFSNSPGSHASSLGLFRTGQAYQGGHGLSMRLRGLERGFNDAAFARELVIHGADYVSKGFAEAHERIGRSWGCFALRRDIFKQVIGALSSPALLFSYFPDPRWLEQSAFLHCSTKALETRQATPPLLGPRG